MTLVKTYLPVALIVIAGIFITSYVAFALTAKSGSTVDGAYFSKQMLSATTTTAVSGPQLIAGADSVTFFFSTTDNAGGGLASTTFNVQVSLDGVTYVDYNKLIDNVSNTNAEMLTRVGTALLSATSTKTYTMDLENESYYTVRCETTAGVPAATSTCDVLIQR